jgi:large subunit ribosomal protein L9
MAKVLLLADVANIGKKGAIIDVKDGFAANFLFPKRLARVATQADIANIGKVKQDQSDNVKKKSKVAQKMSSMPKTTLAENPIKIEVQTSAGGRVHGSIDSAKIIEQVLATMPDFEVFSQDELEVNMRQKIEYVGKYGFELKININTDGKKETYNVPLFVDVVSISEAKRKTK